MIYLIDDKKERQSKDYNWNDGRFSKYHSIIKPIHLLKEIEENNLSEEIFKQGNIILFHESFFDNDKNNSDKDSLDIRRKLIGRAKAKKNYVVSFSGSKNLRAINGNEFHVPVSILYNNLEDFLDQYKSNDFNLKYLLFGSQNVDIEEVLTDKIINGNNDFDIADIPSKNKIFLALNEGRDGIPVQIENFTQSEIIIGAGNNNGAIDLCLNDFICSNLEAIEFESLFIPLCFGGTLSDFNGLKLALLIRCKKNINQLKPIFIYTPVGIEVFLENEYFDILKTKNIYLINYDRDAFAESLNKKSSSLTKEELPSELKKLKLNPPKNYFDNHSIANEWAIYRWAKTIGASDSDIEKIGEKVNTNIYFKYLQSIYPISESKVIDQNALKIENLNDKKILYVDDEADKGWYEIMCTIIADINGVKEFEYLGDEIRSKPKEEIIDLIVNKVREQDTDIVILDFRLHPDDFSEKNIQEVTGIKVLKAIKEMNPGIQIIVFSATNKVWNLQAFQEAGGDGFIIKESPENSVDPDFTFETIFNALKVLKNCSDKTFLKEQYNNFNEIESILKPRTNYKKHSSPLDKDFVAEILKWFELSIKINTKENIQIEKITSSYIFLFSVLENLTNRIINVDTPISDGERNNQRIYKFEFRGKNIFLRNFTEQNDFYKKTDYDYSGSKRIPWHIKILNTLDFISESAISEDELSICVKKRNDLIHSNTTTGDKSEIKAKDIIWLHNLIFNGLKSIP